MLISDRAKERVCKSDLADPYKFTKFLREHKSEMMAI